MLAERENEIRLLNDLLDDSAHGNGKVAIIRGPVATGKTELLSSLARLATERGHLVLRASASVFERHLPFSTLEQALNPTWEPGELVTLESAADKLFQLAAATPIVIAVDNAQHIDADSLSCLCYLAERVGFQRMLIAMAESSSVFADDPYRGALRRHLNARKISLSALSERGIARVLGRELGAAAEQFAPECYHLTGGNPLLVRALVEDAAAGTGSAFQGAAVKRLVPGDAFVTAVGACLHSCDSQVMEVARALAILHEDGSAQLVARLANAEPDVVERSLGVLESAGLAHNGTLRHPAIRRAVLSAIDRPTRNELRTRAVRLLLDYGTTAVVARHLALVPEQLGPWAVPILCDAADEMLAVDETHSAIDYLSLARNATDDEPQRTEITMLLAALRWGTDPAGVRRHLVPLYNAFVGGQLKPELVETVVKNLTSLGYRANAKEMLDKLFVVDGNDDEPPLREAAMATTTELSSKEPRRNAMSALSEAEYRVASLAVLGYSNRQISRKLYITVSTVEQHLTRIYRKLNVSRRSDLPTDLVAVRDVG
ncbi:helix-turn-helix transcriptional regulator [Nocardia terpenica]|uniref:AAA family ATPase n=1 Tax=Nocardia terpenica TaxID=455432 RepID=A0A6G9YY20_9NOCA|nr:LuxR family transcriptional regulator [Nocardia terpenica]QIS18229.1 AAA family ATPase [Nocardia terpenica]